MYFSAGKKHEKELRKGLEGPQRVLKDSSTFAACQKEVVQLWSLLLPKSLSALQGCRVLA